MIAFTLLGGLEVRWSSGSSVAPLSRKGRALLAYLAMNAAQRHFRDKLAALLWDRSAEDQARGSLRHELAALRKVLAAEGRPLLIGRHAVALEPDSVSVDALRFVRLKSDGTIASLEAAAAMYRGDFLDGFGLRSEAFEDWSLGERLRLRDAAYRTLARLLTCYTESSAHEDAIRIAIRMLALDPLLEQAHCTLMRLYAAAERRGEALRQYHACRQLLAREMGVAPHPETQLLAEQIRLGRLSARASPLTGESPTMVMASGTSSVVASPLASRERLD